MKEGEVMTQREEARKLFGEGLSPSEIARELNLPPGTIRGWKSKDGWNAPERNAGTLRSEMPTRVTKERKPKKNYRAPFPPRHNLSVTHGLFARYLPDETREIVEQMAETDPAELLLHQIQLAYAAILRAQKLMHVKDAEDGEEDYFTAGKQAAFMASQARAQATLNGMIKQYEDMRRAGLTTERQEVEIARIRAETDRIVADTARIERTLGNGTEESDATTLTIAQLINNPQPERKIDDYMPGGKLDGVCTADGETDSVHQEGADELA